MFPCTSSAAISMRSDSETAAWQKRKAAGVNSSDLRHIVVAHTGLEPVISALRGQRVNQLHQCAVEVGIIGKPGRR